jgi:hypothetical protein
MSTKIVHRFHLDRRNRVCRFCQSKDAKLMVKSGQNEVAGMGFKVAGIASFSGKKGGC